MAYGTSLSELEAFTLFREEETKTIFKVVSMRTTMDGVLQRKNPEEKPIKYFLGKRRIHGL